jgi:hypothetical protein
MNGAGAIWRRRRRADPGRPRAHFLHIGKTGGTAIKSALEDVREGTYEIVLHPHATTLSQVPRGDRFFFVLRDPVDRFVSGFYSRQRQGRPRRNSPWTAAEERAFARFDTPDRLARAISSPAPEERSHAVAAMRSIGHVRDPYWTWFGSGRYFEKRLGDLLAVLWLPELDTTFPRLCALLGVGPVPPLPDDDVGAHRNPEELDRTLSGEARATLEEWYAADRAFVRRCRELSCFMSSGDC